MDNTKKGEDVDIMVLSDRELGWKEKSLIKYKYFEKFGEQKIDIISGRWTTWQLFPG